MGCCDCGGTAETLAKQAAQRRVLWLVLAINLLIFGGEFGAGIWAASTSLQGDSLDSLGDALVYGLSLLVVGRSLRARSGAALSKGTLQALFALAVLLEVLHKALAGSMPVAQIMLVAAALAMLGNLACLWLLTRWRGDAINMRSVWLCSRNDVIGNAGVLLTAGLILLTGWRWLDLLFGGLMALLFARTAWTVMGTAWPQWRGHDSSVPLPRI
jgi:Co/Zn/Cd efflux system component